MFFVLLIIGAGFQATWGNNITVCDCGRAEVIGLMDIQLPSYCNDKITSNQSVIESYNFFATEEPHTVWNADLCMTWKKERTTTVYFFGSFDTIDTLSTSVTTTEECRQLVNSHVCEGNKMTKLNENVFEYKGSPTEKGTWMQEKTETKKNCEFPKLAKQQGMLLFNRQHGMCLSYQKLELAQCRQVEDQWYKISKTLVVQSFKDQSSCMGFVEHELQRTSKRCDLEKMPNEGDLIRKDYRPKIIPLVWNPETKVLTDGVHCLEAYKDRRVEAVNCSHTKTNQQWTFEPERSKIIRPTEDNGPLLAQHHQYIEDKTLERENALLKEIKEVYWGNLQLRRYTTQLLAENNGLLAAMANNLPLCSRLKPNGMNLIMQQCKAMNITIRGEKTKCGYEPRFDIYTIGRDGYSLHPFQECFWKDQIVNLNGQSYSWNSTFENYTLIYPTYHLATINLQEKFQEINDNELEYQLLQHKAYETSEFEQQNVLNELITRIHEEDGNSISELTLNKHAESRFWSISNWTTSLKTSLILATVLVPIVAFAIMALCYFRLKQLKHQKSCLSSL
ncbi:hypothetical protein DAPPUDRAFT_117510 [Daphnia pulex]|uniref:Ricin B lectin domain-containing protein n=1 Tax=Daphnia pulex TaxID=6669 RepID=E9HSX0_DAPPU|nr:hypothetical protein DAPPUDRAFT_117510 [Daphnia pulex]|eukprot:EFX65165.1 hypothetical protein DAPPUDRAFT_117510 [Daphnia pulex]